MAKKRSSLIQTAYKKRVQKKDAKSRRKAEQRAHLPKSRLLQVVYRLHPKRVYQYWFSRDGLMMALKLSGAGFAVMIILVMGVFAYFRKDLPDPRAVGSRILDQSTQFYDRTGEHLLYEVHGDENRRVVEFDEISDKVISAAIAVEDKDFYEHQGVSFRAIGRAFWRNITSGDATGEGGSTITQQFIKNSLLTTDQTYTRKVQEVILALELERLYTKDEILSFYLNEIPFGPQEYGVQAAAQSFFRKDAKELNTAEAAMLMALPKAPTYYSPYGDNSEELVERAHLIIDLMHEQGYITQEEADEAKEVDILKKVTPISERTGYEGVLAPHFVVEAQRQLVEDPNFGEDTVLRGGLKVITTVDLELQELAEEAVAAKLEADGGAFCDRNGKCGDNAAVVASDVETGQVLAMVGSRGFEYPEYGSFNAALAERQPGSSFKPYDYAQLFTSERWGPDSFIYDTSANGSWGSYNPGNFYSGYRGRSTVRAALGESRNIPALKAASIAGVENVVELAIAMGNDALSADLSSGEISLPHAIGAGEVKLAEHTHAYGTFARGGVYKPQSYILKVEGPNGDVLYEWEDQEGDQVLDAQIAYLITDILKDDAARSGTFGFNSSNLVVQGLNHTVKTGSTNGSVDGLMMGYTAHLAVGVWVGNHDNADMDSFTSHQTGPIFTQFLRESHEKKEYDFGREIQAEPEGIKRVRLIRNTGYAAGEDFDGETYVGLFPSWHSPEFADSDSYIIDTVSGLLATDCTPERAREEQTGGGLWPEVTPDDWQFSYWSGPGGYDGSGGPTEEDDVHKCSDDLPDIDLDVDEVSTGVYEFTAEVDRGEANLTTLTFSVNGSIVSSQNVSKNGGTYSYTHSFDSAGEYTIKAEVVDKLLYDNSRTRKIDVDDPAPTGGSFSITSHSNGEVGVDPDTTFSWGSVAGAASYNFCFKKTLSGGSMTCLDNGGSTSYTPGLDAFTSYDLKIQAENGSSVVTDETSTITIVTGI